MFLIDLLKDLFFIYFNFQSFLLGCCIGNLICFLLFFFKFFNKFNFLDNWDFDLDWWFFFSKKFDSKLYKFDCSFSYLSHLFNFLGSKKNNNQFFMLFIYDFNLYLLMFVRDLVFFYNKVPFSESMFIYQYNKPIFTKVVLKKSKSIFNVHAMFDISLNKLNELFFFIILDEINALYNKKKSVLIIYCKLMIEMKVLNGFTLSSPEILFLKVLKICCKILLQNNYLLIRNNYKINNYNNLAFLKDYLYFYKYKELQYLKLLHYTNRIL